MAQPSPRWLGPRQRKGLRLPHPFALPDRLSRVLRCPTTTRRFSEMICGQFASCSPPVFPASRVENRWARGLFQPGSEKYFSAERGIKESLGQLFSKGAGTTHA